MNKNFKILSSLAAAGIITVTGLTSTVSAATPNSLGVYRKVISGETIAPYVIATANDKVTVQDLKNDHGNITISLSNSEKVATGTTFRKNGEKHTVIIYGDVDGNGDINVNDVTTLAQGVVKGNLTAIKKEAGNVEHNNSTDVNDVTKLARFIVKGEKITVTLPSEEVPATEYDYALEVNGNNVINSETISTSKIKVTPSEVSDEARELTLTIAKKGEDGKYGDDLNVTLITGNKVKLEANERYVEKDIDVSGLTEDGTYRLQAKQGTKVVGETIIERHVDVSKIAANVVVKRAGSLNAVVSLEGYGEAQIVKMYCKIADSNTTVNDALRTDLIENGTVLTISNNTLPETLFTNNDVEAEDQALFYVLEDSYGSIIATPLKVLVANDVETNTQDNTTVEEITANTADNEFTIKLNQDLEEDRNVVATLYLDGKVIASEKIAGTADTDELSVETTTFAAKMTKVGTYTVKAYVEGTQEKQPTATVDSTAKADAGKVVIIQLAQVTNIKFVHDEKTNKDYITWEDSANKEATYTVTPLYPKKANGKYTGEYTTNTDTHAGESDIAALTVTPDATGKKQVEVTGITPNTSYKVQIVANPKAATPQRVLASEEKESNEFYKLSIANLGTGVASENSVKFTGIVPVTLTGNEDAEASYKMGIYSYVDNGNENETKLIKTVDVTLTKTKGEGTYETVVSGLEEGKEYKFVLIATIGNVTVETAQTANPIKISKKAETITNLTVVKGIASEEDAKAGEISYTANATKAYINGKEITVADYTTEFKNMLNDVIAPLAEGDKVTVTADTIEVKLGASGLATTTLGTDEIRDSSLKGKKLVLVGNDAWRTVVTKAGDNNKLAEIVLKAENGKEALFTVGAELNAEKVTLNGIKLKETANKTYTLAAGAANVINSINVTASKDTVVTMAAGKISAKASDSNLNVVNNTGAALEVAILGDNNLDLKQTGKITITSSTGNITVSSPKATVTGSITANVENGTLNITGDTLTGAQKVTVVNKKDANHSETTTVNAKLAASAPVAMSAVVVKDYSELTLDEMKAVTGLTANDVTEENIASIVSFINSLGLKEEDSAKVSVTGEDLKTITIEIKGNVTSYTVPGLQK